MTQLKKNERTALRKNAELFLEWTKTGKKVQFRNLDWDRRCIEDKPFGWITDRAEVPSFSGRSLEFRFEPKGFRKDRPYNTKEEFELWVEDEVAKGKVIVWSSWLHTDNEVYAFTKIVEWTSDNKFTVYEETASGPPDGWWYLELYDNTNQWISVYPKKKEYVPSERTSLMTVKEFDDRYCDEHALQLFIEKWERGRLPQNWEEIMRYRGLGGSSTCGLCELNDEDCTKCILKSCDLDSDYKGAIEAATKGNRAAFLRYTSNLLSTMYKALKV